MLHNPKLLQSSSPQAKLLHPLTPQLHNVNVPATSPSPSPSPSLLSLKQLKLSRRELTICAKSSLLLLLHPYKARAEETPPPDNNIQQEQEQEQEQEQDNVNCSSRAVTKRAFLDIAIDGEPVGRIVVGLYGNDVPAGAARFTSIVSGAAGISYRRKEFVKIMPSYVQHGGLRSYGVDAELAKGGGSNGSRGVESLKEEWGRVYEKCPGVKNLAGKVSIMVRDPSKPPPKLKLVARKGKLEIDEEEIGTDPNGTEFVIAIKDSPELDSSALVIGEVLEGMEVVKRIGQVKTVQENTSSPYFRVAKLIGDKRAVVAERGFNRPYSKVLVANCGLLD